MKKHLAIVLALVMALSLIACGKKEDTPAEDTSVSISEIPAASVEEAPASVEEEEEDDEDIVEEAPENCYASELTNEWISLDIEKQRPVAVMIDNEKVALPHYGTAEADIVYEMMNSTANDRITRLMCIYKDWQNVERIGNIRSTRPTNAMLFAEYNAILVHDGGPFMIDEWLAHPNSTNHLSGGFARIDRDKAGFYEEYATNVTHKGEGEYAGKTYDSLYDRITKAGYDLEYNDFYMGEHFKFSRKVRSLEKLEGAIKADSIAIPFAHNKSRLDFDSEAGVYVYSEYNQEYKDELSGKSLTFENVILEGAPFFEYGEGYMCYNAIGTTNYGYYCTEGYAIPIKWEKPDQDSLTKFYRRDNGEEITLNTGKTYIAIVPLDVWDQLDIK